MADPLDHSILSDPSTRATAARYSNQMADALPDPLASYGCLLALGAMFISLCREHDVDPEATFSQVADHYLTLEKDDGVDLATIPAFNA